MSKNESFHDQYTITLKGKSTNRFVPNILGNMIKTVVKSINMMYQQTDAKLEYKNLKAKKK